MPTLYIVDVETGERFQLAVSTEEGWVPLVFGSGAEALNDWLTNRDLAVATRGAGGPSNLRLDVEE